MIPVQVVGLGMSPADLTPRAREIIREAQVLVGGRRLLDYFPEHRGLKIPLGKDPEGTLKQLPALAETKRVVVLASGDPNFYGVGPLVVKVLGAEQVVIHPNLTAMQTACARLRMPWQDATVISLHGRSWEPLAAALGKPGPLLIYTDPAHPPGEIARFLLARGLVPARFCVLEDLGQETERVTWLSLAEAQEREFSPLNLVVVVPEPGEVSPGVPSSTWGSRKRPWSIRPGSSPRPRCGPWSWPSWNFCPARSSGTWGPGAAPWGWRPACSSPGGRFLRWSATPSGPPRLPPTGTRYGVDNLEVVCAPAPVCLAPLPDPHRVFVGGGGPEVGAIIQEAVRRLAPEGRVVVTAALLETLADRPKRPGTGGLGGGGGPGAGEPVPPPGRGDGVAGLEPGVDCYGLLDKHW